MKEKILEELEGLGTIKKPFIVVDNNLNKVAENLKPSSKLKKANEVVENMTEESKKLIGLK